jgi:hypothetical protein
MNRDLLPNAHRLTESGRLVSITNQSLRSPSGTIRRYSPEGVPTVVVAHTDSDVISNILDVSSTVLFVVAFYQVFDVTCPFSVLALSLVYADRSVFFISIPSRRGLAKTISGIESECINA